jgi:hypothetical protein
VGSLTSHNPIGLQGLLRDSFTLLLLKVRKLLNSRVAISLWRRTLFHWVCCWGLICKWIGISRPVTFGRAACEACSVTWNLGANSAFALEPRKTTENLDRVGRLQDLPDTNWLLASSPALNTQALTLVRICAVLFFTSCFYKYFYVRIIWISIKPCITPTEGINTYMNKYAYKYTYICICDSLIIGKFGSLL